MTGTAASARLVCAELGRRVVLPGGLVLSDELVSAFHAPPQAWPTVYAGQLLVVPRRHTPGFGELITTEAAAVGIAVSRLSRPVARPRRRPCVHGDDRSQPSITFTFICFRAGPRRRRTCRGTQWTNGRARAVSTPRALRL